MGVPVMTLNVNGANARLFFDTGAQYSYVAGHLLHRSANGERAQDFYPHPTAGRFWTTLFDFALDLGGETCTVRAGPADDLPAMVKGLLKTANVDGILGNQILVDRRVCYSARCRSIRFASANFPGAATDSGAERAAAIPAAR